MKAAWADVTGMVHEVVLLDRNDAAVPGGTFLDLFLELYFYGGILMCPPLM